MTAIPRPVAPFERGKIVDAKGTTVAPAKTTLMARLDAKASEKVELSRGTIWLLGTALILAAVVFSYGSSIMSWARDDQSTREKAIQTQRDVEKINEKVDKLDQKFDEIQKGLTDQRVKDAEQRGKTLGYEVGRTDSKAGH